MTPRTMLLFICPVCGWYCTPEHADKEGREAAAHEHPEIWKTEPVAVVPETTSR